VPYADPEAKKAHDRAYHAAHRDRINERSREWREAHPERMRELRRQHYEQHRDEYLERSRAWVEAHPQRRRAIAQKYADSPKGQLSLVINGIRAVARRHDAALEELLA
jgi:ABC-type nitrate/sulfonate/bicarbonate transport system substrate-binding protein